MTDFARIREGLCPHDHGPLERHDNYGWCTTCELGWSIRPDRITLHITNRHHTPDP